MAKLQPLKGAQALASAPDAHVWLSASAGTGKTHVLTARVFRLLLDRVAPESILCLTFTKAGASEMADRIHERLAAWVQMDDTELFNELEALGAQSGPEDREYARSLFARVLEATGGGLRIQTIHAFCQQVLASFPLEAGLIPGFRPLEDREQKELARQTLAEMVLEAEEQGDVALISALQDMALRMGEGAAEEYLTACTGAHEAFAEVGGNVRDWLFAELGLPEGEVEDVIALACSDDAFDIGSLAALIRANVEWNTATGLKHVDVLQGWRESDPAGRAAKLNDLNKVVSTDKGELRKPSAGQLKAEPAYADYATRIAERCKTLLDLRAMVGFAIFLAQALHAGRAFSAAYERAKRKAGAVDYDDLIAQTAHMLDSDGIADWIRFKLDQQIDHILVDEAQDTNNRQWRIVEALAGEFFAGEGAKGDRLRTLFTVGDFKQAIYGFQGTSPQAFADARALFRDKADQAGMEFHDLSLDLSFRSTPAVLDVVDAVIAKLGSQALGLSDDDVFHDSHRQHPGEVTLWKPVSAYVEQDGDEDSAEGEEEWQAEQNRLLAEKIAGQIRQWLDDGLMLESQGRQLRPGDIMILLRSRGELARLIIARLYEAGVDVAGIDRIRLSAPLAVMDLMAALRFAAQPEDDLNLANLLVSPLIGWSQEELLAHSVPRKGSLWQHLRRKADEPDLALLFDMLAQADFITPYQFLEHILSGPAQGRRKLLARLGEQARDAIEELCQAALAFEQQGHPALQPFLDWFDREEGDIKRESDGQGDAVRILTVHGSKGLQAPVVILADATHDPLQKRGASRIEWPVGEAGKLPFIAPRKAEAGGRLAEAVELQQARELEEHWRLLYVALTRAEERLVLTGSLGPRAKGVVPMQSWFIAVSGAMEALGAAWDEDKRWGSVCRWHGPQGLERAEARKKDVAAMVEVAMPAWLHSAAPEEARPPRPLAPTAPGEDDSILLPPSPAMRQAAERGKWLHALFERLPDLPADQRRDAAERWLERSCGIGDSALRQDLIDHALGIVEAPAFADLFAPAALSEAPIAAVVGEDVIAGTVDRLLVTDDLVRIVDFKTGRSVPQRYEDIPPAHLRQMAAYVAALEVIFPGKAIEASLLYTAGPAILRLDSELLTPHKPGFRRTQ